MPPDTPHPTVAPSQIVAVRADDLALVLDLLARDAGIGSENLPAVARLRVVLGCAEGDQ